ncbi:MAG: hypothetical protein VYE68_13465 [Acidobacteriota bacterium]|nr:hypothetical protein [Acidobacteriota bacterium]
MTTYSQWLVGSCAVMLVLATTPVSAQSSSEYVAPRAPDGRPDLNGIWQALGSAHWDVEAHSAGPSVVRELGALSAVPGGLGIIVGDTIPYTPEARAQRDENRADQLGRDPAIKCYLPGVPRGMYMPFPVQIIQSQAHIMILHEFAGAVRTVYMEDQMEAPADSWMGWSNGHWDGDSLVIDTTGFNGQTWFDRSGNFHTDALRVVERITPRSPETLWYEVTIEDPNVFTRPWQIRMPLYRRVEDNARVLEFRCVEFVEDLIYGHLRKTP